MTRDQFIAEVERCQKSFRRFLTALCCGDAPMADDIAQDAFIKAYLAIDKLSDVAKFKAWIYRIGYNSFLDNKRAERPTTDLSAASAIDDASMANPLFKYEKLYAALSRLSRTERTVILLFYFEDRPLKEIVEITGASESAVKKQLERGRNHLKEYMGQMK